MAVEKEVQVEVVLARGEDVKEVLSKHGNAGPVVEEDANGGSKTDSNGSDKMEEAKGENNGAGDIGCGSGESKTNSNSSDEVEQVKNKIRIMVSGRKKPLFFYINLTKKYLSRSYDVELSALGLAIPTVITISEFLKRHGLAAEKNIRISTVTKPVDENSRAIVKAQIEILLGSSDSTGRGLVAS